MTRDEAIELLAHAVRTRKHAENWVDAFVRLGMLSLNEPITASNKFASILADWVDPVEVAGFCQDMHEAGLEVVEKDKTKSEFKYNPTTVR